MAAATEPRGGIRASISRPSLTSALAMETTTFPARGSRRARTVAMALSQRVATTTSSAAPPLARRSARALPPEADVLEIDGTSPEHLPAAGEVLAARRDRLDGLLHAIGFAPPDCLGSGMFAAGWDDVSVALNISTYSLKALVDAFLPLLSAAGGAGRGPGVRRPVHATLARAGAARIGRAQAALGSRSP